MQTRPAALFLDFDGVLHDAKEAVLNEDGRVVLDNPRLFTHTPLLAKELAPYPEVRIIVSSDWQQYFDDASLVRLLGPLGNRFLGVTDVRAETRAHAILRSAERRGLTFWLALDDHDSVVEASRTDDRFIACPPSTGVSDSGTLNTLRSRLSLALRQ